MSVYTENISYSVSVNFENNDRYYRLQVVPLHWSLNLTSQETIWAKRKQINLENVKAAIILHIQSNAKLLPT